MSIQLIDTHCHLDFAVFDGWRDQLLADARSDNVTRFVVPGVTAGDWPGLLATCDAEGLYPALGLHPCFLDQHKASDLAQLEQLLSFKPVVAVGEIGLDFFVPNLDQEKQIELFTRQLEIARQFQLPVLLHVRKAHDQVLKLLRRFKLTRGGIVHAYSGSEQQAVQYIELGFKLGVGGSLTYDRAKKLRRIATHLPLDAFVLETDSPDIPLAGYRGEPNQPRRVREVAEVFAELRGISLEELAQCTSATARHLLRL
ncbi:MAG: TatD family hydrolase [Oceanospirillaceae bacterium]|nr:TatD family hydrolase [Oceanospirillaceae bacterium]